MLNLTTSSEQDLVRELTGLDQRIATGGQPRDRGSRSALAFLVQLRRDRQQSLERLRLRRGVTALRR
jgi:hypothetical protein